MYKLNDVLKLKQKIRESNAAPEVVSEESYLRAKANLDTMFINNEKDAFLFYASLNLLNTYVKQNKDKISYAFKEDVKSGFDSIIVNKIKDATYCYDPAEKVLIINIKGMQFSFHNVTPSAKMNFARMFEKRLDRPYYAEQKWEGLRLQPVAETLFKYANNLEGLSNESLVGNLKDYQNERVAEYQKNNTLNM